MLMKRFESKIYRKFLSMFFFIVLSTKYFYFFEFFLNQFKQHGKLIKKYKQNTV